MPFKRYSFRIYKPKIFYQSLNVKHLLSHQLCNALHELSKFNFSCSLELWNSIVQIKLLNPRGIEVLGYPRMCICAQKTECLFLLPTIRPDWAWNGIILWKPSPEILNWLQYISRVNQSPAETFLLAAAKQAWRRLTRNW